MKMAAATLSLLMPLMSQAEILSGTALNQKGEVVYLERHEIQRGENGLSKLIKVDYTNPKGKVFAKMTSDFSKNNLVPETEYEDFRFKSKQTLKIINDSVEFVLFNDGVEVEKKFFPLKSSMVASQGFDNYIRSHASKLSLNSQSFKFGVLGAMDFFTLTGYKRPSKSAEELEFGIKASSWLIRMFAGELRVVYDAQTMRLKTFAGRSNLVNDKGASQDVIINYEWKEGE